MANGEGLWLANGEGYPPHSTKGSGTEPRPKMSLMHFIGHITLLVKGKTINSINNVYR